jgi:hypothetical protein
MVCEHSFHFIDLESENEHYTENDVCKIRQRSIRFAKFICNKCGLLKKVEVVNG